MERIGNNKNNSSSRKKAGVKKAGLWMLAFVLALTLGLSACGGGNSGAGSGGGEGDVYTFKLDTPDSIDSITGSFLSAWADEVREASDGRIDIKVYPNGQLGAVPDIINNLKSGVSDIAWGSPAMFSGTFPVTEGTNFPMLDIPSSQAGTDLLWDLYEKTDLMQKEYDGLHVLLLTNCCPYYFASAKGGKPINTVEDLKGMKVRTQGTYPSILMTALGAEPVSQHAS